MSENKNLQEDNSIENNPENKDSKNLEFLNSLLNSSTNSNPEPNISINKNINQQSNDISSTPIINNSEKPEDILNNLDFGNNPILSNPLDKQEIKIPDRGGISSETINKIDDLKMDTYNKDTLHEDISESLKRDMNLIWTKLKYVINPLIPEKDRSTQVRQWDLWGPLIFTCLLSMTLAIRANEKGDTFTLIFIIFWIGSLLVFLNANLLGIKISVFQIICLLGYCLFPLNIAAIILSLGKFFEFFRLIILVACCSWSSYSIRGFLINLASKEQRLLVIYPAILVYLFISGVILMNRF